MKKVWVTTGLNIILAGCLVFLLFFYEGTPHAQKKATDGGNATSAPSATSSSKAEEIASTTCMTCHGKNLEGGNGPALNKIGSKYDQKEIENIINHGKNAMPAGVVSSEEAKVVAKWLAQKK
ncbi:MAG: c-type cytochrome [Bacillus sp. (in: firmicutes)]|jgi:cytochrome c551